MIPEEHEPLPQYDNWLEVILESAANPAQYHASRIKADSLDRGCMTLILAMYTWCLAAS
jgi:hypothetical protein